jgi:hypothetical protein
MGGMAIDQTLICRRIPSRPFPTCQFGFNGMGFPTNLCPSISWESVIPQTLVWAFHWLLIMVAVCLGSSCQCGDCTNEFQHSVVEFRRSRFLQMTEIQKGQRK